MKRRALVRLFALCAAVLMPAGAAAQSGENVLVVINTKSEASVRIGEAYARARAVPQNQVVRLEMSTADTVSRPEYDGTIEGPISAALARHSLQDKVLYIVLTKGVPIRIDGTVAREGTVASVDSELTLLYRRMVGIRTVVPGRVGNPYYLDTKNIGEARYFTRLDSDLYLVTRLDGFTVDDVLKLIERGIAPSREGLIVLDQRSTLLDAGGDAWLQQAADRLQKIIAADRVVLETSRLLAAASGPVLGYYSWGSNDPANRQRKTGLQFANGAIAGMFVSTDGRTFAEPPAEWIPVENSLQVRMYGRGSQSSAGDLIRDGVTGVSAHVAEPFLDATIRPQILFPIYLSGFNLAEAFYSAMPFLSWQTMIIGDPLCAPGPRRSVLIEELHKGIDPETELPRLFAERRLAQLSTGGMNAEALKLTLKYEATVARGDQKAAENLLAQATALEPRLLASQLHLASIYEIRSEHDKAIERYRKILEIDADNVIALNNLAYSLAVNKNDPRAALPLAERVSKLSSHSTVLDTVGWVYYLLGDNRLAGAFLERAVKADPRSVDILLHVATVYAAQGNTAQARAALDAADKLDPKFKERADAKALREKLK